jgi:hypothetical protein
LKKSPSTDRAYRIKEIPAAIVNINATYEPISNFP